KRSSRRTPRKPPSPRRRWENESRSEALFRPPRVCCAYQGSSAISYQLSAVSFQRRVLSADGLAARRRLMADGHVFSRQLQEDILEAHAAGPELEEFPL